jgi:hypothetical protein
VTTRTTRGKNSGLKAEPNAPDVRSGITAARNLKPSKGSGFCVTGERPSAEHTIPSGKSFSSTRNLTLSASSPRLISADSSSAICP